jgi:NitT/TauT family transport system substrate-binding protein
MATPNTLRIALDWTPNTNHVGFYVALQKGWYEEAGISVSIHFMAEKGYYGII